MYGGGSLCCCNPQKTALRSWFSSSTVWVPENGLRSLSLEANAFISPRLEVFQVCLSHAASKNNSGQGRLIKVCLTRLKDHVGYPSIQSPWLTHAGRAKRLSDGNLLQVLINLTCHFLNYKTRTAIFIKVLQISDYYPYKYWRRLGVVYVATQGLMRS